MADEHGQQRSQLIATHEAAIDALHHGLKEHTAAEHHERLAHAIDGVKTAFKVVKDDDAFGSPGNAGY